MKYKKNCGKTGKAVYSNIRIANSNGRVQNGFDRRICNPADWSLRIYNPIGMICFGLQSWIFQHSDCKSEWTGKQGHWMWYIFPQIAGLGFSETSKYYAVNDIEEAQKYLNHPVLGKQTLLHPMVLIFIVFIVFLHYKNN
jgi:hypothetical protein